MRSGRIHLLVGAALLALAACNLITRQSDMVFDLTGGAGGSTASSGTGGHGVGGDSGGGGAPCEPPTDPADCYDSPADCGGTKPCEGFAYWSVALGTGLTHILGVATDLEGNVFVGGEFSGKLEVGQEMVVSDQLANGFLAAYDGEGVGRWVKKLDGALGVSSINAVAMVSGGVAVAANGGAAPVTGVMAYDAAGAPAWQLLCTTPTSTAIQTNAIAVAVDAIYFGGHYHDQLTCGTEMAPTMGGADEHGFVAKLTPDGQTVLWVVGFGGDQSDVVGLAAVTGGVVVVGSASGTKVTLGACTASLHGGKDALVAAVSASGACAALRAVGDGADQEALSAASDGEANAIVAGRFAGLMDWNGHVVTAGSASDLFVTRVDASGAGVSARAFPVGGPGGFLGAVAVTLTATETFLAGSFDGSLELAKSHSAGGATHGFTAGLDGSTLEPLWSADYGEPGGSMRLYAVAAAGTDIVVGGEFTGTLKMGSGELHNMNPANPPVFIGVLAKLRP